MSLLLYFRLCIRILHTGVGDAVVLTTYDTVSASKNTVCVTKKIIYICGKLGCQYFCVCTKDVYTAFTIV